MSKNISRSIKLFSIQKKKMRLNRVDSSDWGDFFENKETMWNFFFNFRTKKQVMAIFDIDFVFSYPYFVPDVLNAIERSTKNFEIGAFGNRNHVLTSLEIHKFKNEKSMFICCFDHLLDSMHFGTKSCLHYYRRVFFRMLHDNSPYKIKKCYRCYRRSIRSILKYYPRLFY